ncbi:hypothetical protein TEA_011478 [Camellia sinensis var. sinensis]|uniref:Uncharacterized protein n=1 Tax=Camellia sinensis var. sinensis TaxID=542762 RepID=A0A4S4CWJ3_CAMSN|nr:hypothetical protein TEA_011478 [Camellia sinensis var. sinensis]
MENTEKEITSDEPKYRGLKAMPFVIGNETFEKLGTLGTSSNLLVYLTTVFNMDTITSTNLINIFNGTCNFGTLLGAFLSDTYFGRYKTLGFASISSFLVINALSLSIPIFLFSFHRERCSPLSWGCHLDFNILLPPFEALDPSFDMSFGTLLASAPLVRLPWKVGVSAFYSWCAEGLRGLLSFLPSGC